MNETTVNIPLLRKAVEWAEAEAAKPPELSQWSQGRWRTVRAQDEAPACGTAFCIAGYVAEINGFDWTRLGSDPDAARVFAQELLGLSSESWYHDDDHLFDADNSVADVRRIAEEIAGERL